MSSAEKNEISGSDDRGVSDNETSTNIKLVTVKSVSSDNDDEFAKIKQSQAWILDKLVKLEQMFQDEKARNRERRF